MSIFGYAICVCAAAVTIAIAAHAVATSMARQPEVQSRLFTVFILACAFVEALGLIGFVACLIL